MNRIDPTSLPTNSTLAVALRQVSKHWPLAYSKLLSLDWFFTDSVLYGATDGRELLLNPDGLRKLDSHTNRVGLCAFLLAHEALHALLGHGWRLAKLRDAQTANIAADYIINAMIDARNRELGFAAFPFIEGVLLDPKLSGDKSVEQLYRELQKGQPQQPPQQSKQPQQDNDDQQQDEEDGNTDQEEADSAGADSDGDSTGGGDGDDSSAGSPADGGADMATAPSDLEGFVGTGAVDNHQPTAGHGEAEDEVVGKIERDNDRLLIADHIERATGGMSGMTGTRITQQRVLPPPMPWADLLREWLRGNSRSGWSSPFNAPVFGSTGLVSLGRRKRTAGQIVLVVDTSGSVPAHIYDRFLNEARAILEELQPEQLHLLSVSHYVCDAHTMERGDQLPPTLKGGGGTLFAPAFEWVYQQGIVPEVLIYLTDGLAADTDRLPEPDYPVLWVSTYSQPEHYPFGSTIMTNDY